MYVCMYVYMLECILPNSWYLSKCAFLTLTFGQCLQTRQLKIVLISAQKEIPSEYKIRNPKEYCIMLASARQKLFLQLGGPG